MISYSYSLKILHVIMQGEICYDDIVAYLHEFPNIEIEGNTLHLLYDLREADMALSFDEVSKISELAEQATQKYTYVHTAFLVAAPKSTALSMLFSRSAKDQRTERRLFSTESAALKWLKENNNNLE